MMTFVRTTLNISDALLEELRERAREEKTSMTAVIEETLKRGLSSGPEAAGPVQIETFEAGIKPAYRGMSLNQLYDQLEAEEVGKVAEE